MVPEIGHDSFFYHCTLVFCVLR